MKILILTISLIFISYNDKGLVNSTHLRVEKNFQEDKVKKIGTKSYLYYILNFLLNFFLIKKIVNEYLNDPYKYIPNHSNKENFIAIFGNYTNNKSDVTKDLDKYLENNHKDIQSVIDKINNFQTNNIVDWDFDTTRQKFTLPDESKLL